MCQGALLVSGPAAHARQPDHLRVWRRPGWILGALVQPGQSAHTATSCSLPSQGTSQTSSVLIQVPEYVYPKDHVPDYLSILVPNVDNVRMDFLMQTIMKQGKGLLLTGEQGTAKTVMVKVS